MSSIHWHNTFFVVTCQIWPTSSDQSQVVSVLPRVVLHTFAYFIPSLGQTYTGNVTIMPSITTCIGGLLTVLSNPTVDFMQKAKVTGEQMTWPFMAMIKNHSKIELALDRAYKDISEVCHFSNRQTDLARLSRPSKRPTLRRNGSTQSLPDGFSITSLTACEQSTARTEVKPPVPAYTANTHIHFQTEEAIQEGEASNRQFDTTESDELDQDSMTSQSPQECSENDGDEDIEEFTLQDKSGPALPTTPCSYEAHGRPRPRPPGVTPMALLMTPATIPPARIDSGLNDGSDTPSMTGGYTKSRDQRRISRPIEIPSVQTRQRSLSTGFL